MTPWPDEAQQENLLSQADSYGHDSRGAVSLASAVRRLLARVRELEKREAELTAVCKAYEQWEADLLLSKEAWRHGLAEFPTLTESLWDRLLALQTMRNIALKGTP